ncbi:MAG: SapC family protein [Alphaproteobacteria bacterium]
MSDTDSDAAGQLPLLYHQPRPLQHERHGGTYFVPPPGYGFAAQANSVPLNAVEFAIASRHYPIIFAGAPPHLPLAVLGLRPGQNVMLDGGGDWAKGAYVPAYIRRYPFIFLEDQDGQRLTLCIDEGANMLSNTAGEPLFVDGEPGPFVKRATDFCAAFQRQHIATRGFVAALVEHDLLVEKAATAKLSSGAEVKLTGLRLVDEQKFNALPDDVFLDWRRKGWLPMIYFHLISAHNWGLLADRME